MRNLRLNYSKFRMIDVKIGGKTAQAGWKGKSRVAAIKHHLMDGMTNSAAEGHRLAGFDGIEQSIFESMNPLIDFDLMIQNTALKKHISESDEKFAQRVMLNVLDGTKMLRLFLDLHIEEKDETREMLSVEIAEIVAHEINKRLVGLSVHCSGIETPQKWIGSSCALCYDASLHPNRDDVDGEKKIRSKVSCNVFDWGRSELLTSDDFQHMTDEEKADRQQFWKLYRFGLDRLSYNATRFYYNQFTNIDRWVSITLTVMDYDSQTSDDRIGSVTIKLPNQADTKALSLMSPRTYKLRGGPVSLALGSSIDCSIRYLKIPSPSRIHGVWQ